MHEFGIARKLLGDALAEAKKARAGKIKEIVIELGEIADVTAEELTEAFKVVSEGTIAEKARIKIEIEKPKIKCLNGHESEWRKEAEFSEALFLDCPVCGEKAMLSGGTGRKVKRVVFE
ncbi:MAG: hydrogenase maturation nickel metallochaperone HypA [Candidatus Diapherotrites archaeon]